MICTKKIVLINLWNSKCWKCEICSLECESYADKNVKWKLVNHFGINNFTEQQPEQKDKQICLHKWKHFLSSFFSQRLITKFSQENILIGCQFITAILRNNFAISYICIDTGFGLKVELYVKFKHTINFFTSRKIQIEQKNNQMVLQKHKEWK